MSHPAQAIKPHGVQSVPLLDLAAQYAQIEDEVKTAILDVVASQRFILGPPVKDLEEELAPYCQCEHGVGVSSGTDALVLALMALEVGANDAVITTAYSFFATAGSVARLGAIPLFCDVDPHTYNLSADSIESLIADRCDWSNGRLVVRETGRQVKAIMPVHLYGQCADMDEILRIAKAYDLFVVEDAAQAIGAEDAAGRRAGSIGDIGCFSFFPSKNLGAYGDAGMCTTNDPALAERMRMLRVHGAKPKYYHKIVGGNFRMDAVQAAVLQVKSKYLDGWTERRGRNANDYATLMRDAGLLQHVTPPVVEADKRHVFNQFVIRVTKRDELREFLASRGVGTEVYYPEPLHRQECFSQIVPVDMKLPEAESAARETVALPIYPELTIEQLQHVVTALAEFYLQ